MVPYSDDSLRLAVIAALTKDKRGVVDNLRVGVINGVAHLSGTVPTIATWELAQETASQVPGIRGVVNRLEAPGAPPPGRVINLDLPKQDSDQSKAGSDG